MARLRKFVAFRNLKRPYTRVSKFKSKSYIRISPNPKVVKFSTGNTTKEFPCKLSLQSTAALNIRDNALESARQTSNRVLESNLGVASYRMNVRVYPHQVIRENPVASGAGADRFSTGMKKAFGKPVGICARVKPGQAILEVNVTEKNIDVAKKALHRAASKLPCTCKIAVNS